MEYEIAFRTSAPADRRLFTTEPAVGWIAVERRLDSRETPLSAIVSRANDPGECADQSRFPRFRQGFIRASRRSRRRSTKKKFESALRGEERERKEFVRVSCAWKLNFYHSYEGEKRRGRGGGREKVEKNQGAGFAENRSVKRNNEPRNKAGCVFFLSTVCVCVCVCTAWQPDRVESVKSPIRMFLARKRRPSSSERSLSRFQRKLSKISDVWWIRKIPLSESKRILEGAKEGGGEETRRRENRRIFFLQGHLI